MGVVAPGEKKNKVVYRVKYSVFFSYDENDLIFLMYLKTLGLLWYYFYLIIALYTSLKLGFFLFLHTVAPGKVIKWLVRNCLDTKGTSYQFLRMKRQWNVSPKI